MQYTKLVKVFLLVVLLSLYGCASFEKEQLGRLEAMPDLSQYHVKPSVFVDFAFYRGKPDEGPVEVPRVIDSIRPAIENAVAKSGLFSSYTFDKEQAGASDYVVRIKAYNHGSKGGAFASGFICGLTLGIIPGAATDNYIVEVEAIDKNGNVLSKKMNADAVQTWIGIWFIPMMGHTPVKAVNNTLENQVATALVELFKEKVFQYSLYNGFSFAG